MGNAGRGIDGWLEDNSDLEIDHTLKVMVVHERHRVEVAFRLALHFGCEDWEMPRARGRKFAPRKIQV